MKTKIVMQTFSPGTKRARTVPVKVGYCKYCKSWITAVGDGIATHSPCKGPSGVSIRLGMMDAGWEPDNKTTAEVWRRGPQVKVLPA